MFLSSVYVCFVFVGSSLVTTSGSGLYFFVVNCCAPFNRPVLAKQTCSCTASDSFLFLLHSCTKNLNKSRICSLYWSFMSP